MSSAERAFDEAVSKLKKYVDEKTPFCAIVLVDEYPAKVAFIPRDDGQMSLFGGKEKAKSGKIIVTVGIETDVLIDSDNALPARILKKLIRLSEETAYCYYQMYREERDKYDENK